MKTINNIIKESAIGTLSNTYKFAVLSLFSGILVTLIALITFMLSNMAYVSARFNF
jgi:hypothetical protein